MGNTVNNGWIKVPRSILDSWLAGDPLAMAIYMQIRLRARWEDEPVTVDGVEVGCGQVLICQRKLAALLAAPEHAVRSRIRRMIAAGIFAKETFGNGVLITVLGVQEDKPVAGKIAGSSQKRRRSVAPASQSRASLPIIEEHKKNEEIRNKKRASAYVPSEPEKPEGWDEGEWND